MGLELWECAGIPAGGRMPLVYKSFAVSTHTAKLYLITL